MPNDTEYIKRDQEGNFLELSTPNFACLPVVLWKNSLLRITKVPKRKGGKYHGNLGGERMN